jgi:hypothetical protein
VRLDVAGVEHERIVELSVRAPAGSARIGRLVESLSIAFGMTSIFSSGMWK